MIWKISLVQRGAIILSQLTVANHQNFFRRSKKVGFLRTCLEATDRHRPSICSVWFSRTRIDFGYRPESELWLQDVLGV